MNILDKLIPLLLLIMLSIGCIATTKAQKWVTKSFDTQQLPEEEYGTAIDFAGKEQSLRLDVTVPTNDVPPPCGRPLVVFVHGGGFLGGTKNDASIRRLAVEFAQRGFASAAVNYRLGMFQPSQFIHCNLVGWDCTNTADSSEWIRGAYRGMQDVNGAIRYLITHRERWQIDPANVFLIGESAGGFITMMAGYLDESEKPVDAALLPDVPRPHSTYQSCADTYQWGTPVNQMNLSRPDLGSVAGHLHLDAPPYTIKGVASIYGGIFFNYFNWGFDIAQPPLYLYHQPNDLIVPFRYDRVLEGYADCARSGANCSDIVNRPLVRGGKGIETLTDELANQGYAIPDIYKDFSNNTTDCLGQVLFPESTGHAFDNFNLRTGNLATFFSIYVDDDPDCSLNNNHPDQPLTIQTSPNPFTDILTIHFDELMIKKVTLIDFNGAVIKQNITSGQQINTIGMAPGMYFVIYISNQGKQISKLIKTSLH